MSLTASCDLIITVAYFSIPLQILVSLWKSPPERKIPMKLVVTLVLFALFIFLCGAGHLMRYMGKGHSTAFVYLNVATALVSLVTAVYLVPLIPCMFSLLDESLNRLTNESKESKSKLFTFMAFLCHEIRNPLFAITSSAEFLKDTDLCNEQAEEVSSICDSSLLMLRLVNDVLDLSKLDSGKLELEAREFDLHSLLRRLGENMMRQVQRKHKGQVALNFDVAPDVPRVIIGDSCRILQIVYNLLSNSCKFTSEGKVDLTVRLANEAREDQEREEARLAGAHTVTMSSDRPIAMLSSEYADDDEDNTNSRSNNQNNNKDADESQLFSMALLDNADIQTGESALLPKNPNEDIQVLSIAVADSGIGIPVDRLRNIFEPYTQAKLSDFRQHGGTGLGLSIISSLIKTMGGTISVTSKAGEGTCFHLKIPVRVPHQSSLPADHDNDDGDAHHNHHHDSGDGEHGGAGGDASQYMEARRLPVYESSNTRMGAGETGNEGTPNNNNNNTSISTTTTGGGGGALFDIGGGSSSSYSNGAKDLLSGDSPSAGQHQSSAQRTREGSPPRSKSPPPRNNKNHQRNASSSLSLPPFDFPPRSNLVLVVDDNSVNRKILGKMLTTYKIEHEMACNGKEAVDILMQSRNHTGDVSRPKFGLVFMDVSMPVMDGNAAITAIRKAKITVPIVALSANVLSQERDRTICLGADQFHTKPILRNDLHRLCTQFLYNAEHPAPAGATILPVYPESVDGIDDSMLRVDSTGSLRESNQHARKLSGDRSASSLIQEDPQVGLNLV